ncbi:hypothetical protein C5Q97_15570 [Victivallales bacterium CCUG 44730]|nr:hypothetical protein C5Q97_15570 [Victivallales bacterium CCUG 44730]
MFGNTSPGDFFHPVRKKRRIVIAEMIFFVTPWNFFNDNTLADRTTDAPHSITKKYAKTPHRNKLKQPHRKSIIAGRWRSADTAKRFTVGSRLDFHDDGFFLFVNF